MKKKNLLIICTITLSLCPNLPAQQNRPATATISNLIHHGVSPDAIIYQEGDRDPPPPGQVMTARWRYLNRTNQKIGELLQAAPDDITGKQSPWYPRLLAWKALFDQFLTTKSRAELFALLPEVIAYHIFRYHSEESELSYEMDVLPAFMSDVVFFAVEELALEVTESGGQLDATVLSNATKLFSTERLVESNWWSDDPIPVDTGALMIIDANAVVAQLKAGPWQEAKTFLGGATTTEDRFWQYTADGEGLSVLKTKYAAQKELIDAKFYELKEWVEQQQALEPPEAQDDEGKKGSWHVVYTNRVFGCILSCIGKGKFGAKPR